MKQRPEFAGERLNNPDISVAQLARAARGLLFGDPVPLFASLELTLRCNGSCVFCGSNEAAAALGPDLPTSDWNAIIDDLARSGCLRVSLTGGEPLLRTDAEALACRAAGAGMRVSLNTNGRLLDRRRSILKYLSAVKVSIDGVETVNDGLRGHGAFAAAVSAVRTARHAGVPVDVTTVLSKAAIENLDEFLTFARDMDLAVMFQPQYESRLRSRDPGASARPSPEAVRQAFSKIRSATRGGLRVLNSEAGMALLEDSFAGRDVSIACPGGRFFIRIAADGKVGVCGLDNDPCVRECVSRPDADLDARDGVVWAMKRIPWPFQCAGCLSGARADLCALTASRDAGGRRVRCRT